MPSFFRTNSSESHLFGLEPKADIGRINEINRLRNPAGKAETGQAPSLERKKTHGKPL